MLFINSPQKSTGSQWDSLPEYTLVIGYFLIQVAANFTVAKSTELPFGMIIPIGSLLYAISFTWTDLVNIKLGKSRALTLVVVSILGNILLVIWLQLYITLPGTGDWSQGAINQQAAEMVFGGLPRIYIAGWLTNYICASADVLIFYELMARLKTAPRWLRSALSNTIAGPLDGVLFAVLAFYGTMPTLNVVAIAGSSALFKLSIGWLSSPLIYLVHRPRSAPNSIV